MFCEIRTLYHFYIGCRDGHVPFRQSSRQSRGYTHPMHRIIDDQSARSDESTCKTGKLTRSVRRRQTCRCNGLSCTCECQLLFELLGSSKGAGLALDAIASTQSCTCSDTINDFPHTRSAFLHVVVDGCSLRAAKFLARIPR